MDAIESMTQGNQATNILLKSCTRCAGFPSNEATPIERPASAAPGLFKVSTNNEVGIKKKNRKPLQNHNIQSPATGSWPGSRNRIPEIIVGIDPAPSKAVALSKRVSLVFSTWSALNLRINSFQATPFLRSSSICTECNGHGGS